MITGVANILTEKLSSLGRPIVDLITRFIKDDSVIRNYRNFNATMETLLNNTRRSMYQVGTTTYAVKMNSMTAGLRKVLATKV